MTYMIHALYKAQRSFPELRIAVPSWRSDTSWRRQSRAAKTRRSVEAQFRPDFSVLMQERSPK